MLVVNVKENESIDRALKRLKKKSQRAGTLTELKARQYFEKPSITRRTEKIKAAYRQKMQAAEQQNG